MWSYNLNVLFSGFGPDGELRPISGLRPDGGLRPGGGLRSGGGDLRPGRGWSQTRW